MQNEPVIEIDEYGNKFWYSNDQLHRTDGPAIEYVNGDKYWCLHGKIHRKDGPAIEHSSGRKCWCLDDIKYSFEEWLKLTPLSEQEKVKLRLQYAK